MGKTRTYRLSERTINALQELVNETQLEHSALVDALLWQATNEVQAGRWIVGKQPARWALTGIERSGRQAGDR